MTIGENRNKDWLKNGHFCGIWNSPFCDHRAIKLMQNCVYFPSVYQSPCTAFRHSWIPPQERRYLNFSACCCALPRTCSEHCLGFVERRAQYLGFLVLIFIPAWSHAAENGPNSRWRPIQNMQAVPNRPQKQTVDHAASNSNTFVFSAVTVHPIHVNYEEEQWEHIPTSESHNNDERLWFNSTDTVVLVAKNTMTWCPVTGGRQHRTPATFHKAFHEEPGRTLSRKFAVEGKFGLWYYDRDENRNGAPPT